MIKLIKEKFLVSLVVIIMLVLAVGNVNSLATSTLLLPTNTSSKNTANAASALTNNNVANTGATDELGTSGNSSNTNSNRSRNNTSNTNASNRTRNTNNTEKESSSGNKLPYAGTNGTVVFVVIALALSAVYAYKKVSDYNI